MKFKIFGTKIYISFLFCATVTLMLLTDKTGLFIPTFIAVALHEAGHLFCMWVLDTSPKEIILIPASIRVIKDFKSKQTTEIAVLLAGPLLNIAVFCTALLNYALNKNVKVLEFAILNAVVGVFNLLPFGGLDGGSVLTIILSKKTNLYSAQSKVKVLSVFGAVAIAVSGIVLLLKGKANPTVFIAALYIFICGISFKG